jgi:ubiquinone/menaquinone biosynthesis C-methylase UbiE
MSSTQAQPQPQREVLPSWTDKNTATRYVKMEKGTRPFAAVMVQKAQLAHLTSPVNILDLACGTGAVVKEIYDAVPREKWLQLNILAGDTSEPMLEFLHERAKTQGWSGVETRKVDGGVRRLHSNSIGCAWYRMLTDKPRRTCTSQPQATRTSSSTLASS